MDSAGHGYAAAAFSWALRGRTELMRSAAAKLTREQVLEMLGACGVLAGELAARHTELAGAEMAELAEAMLTPDALPDCVSGPA